MTAGRTRQRLRRTSQKNRKWSSLIWFCCEHQRRMGRLRFMIKVQAHSHRTIPPDFTPSPPLHLLATLSAVRGASITIDPTIVKTTSSHRLLSPLVPEPSRFSAFRRSFKNQSWIGTGNAMQNPVERNLRVGIAVLTGLA